MALKVVEIIRDRQSTLASGLAALLIIVVGFLVFNYLSGINKTPAPQITPESTQTAQLNPQGGSLNQANQPGSLTQANNSPQTTYKVVRGDNLSQIAQKYYGDGNKWTVIAQANNLANPSVIHAGNVLSIPNAPTTPTQVAQSSTPATAVAPVTTLAVKSGSMYTVKSGDTLWDLAIQVYGSGYQWYRIDEANGTLPRNSLGKPVIVPGQILKIA